MMTNGADVSIMDGNQQQTGSKNAIATLRKLIVTERDLQEFHASPHFHALWDGFILPLNDELAKPPQNYDCSSSEPSLEHQEWENMLIQCIDKCQDALAQFPRGQSAVKDSKARFGHVEFRAYYDHLHRNVNAWLPGVHAEAVEYLKHSFGNRDRIDYGTGHELNFIVALHVMVQSRQLQLRASLVARVFHRYLQWMRVLQQEYWLEPAGSHGVWGLDDYQMLPFLFGSAQLVGHPTLRPRDIASPTKSHEASASGNLLFECCDFIYSVKQTGGTSLAWHSPLLYDISQITARREFQDGRMVCTDSDETGWQRVNQGLLKMYRGECLNKLPIMQHFLFGSVVGGVGTSSAFKQGNGHAHAQDDHTPLPTADDDNDKEVVVKWVTKADGTKVPIYGKMAACRDHNHVDTFAMGQAFPTCCNMRVPSSVHGARSAVDQPRMPFD